MRVTQRDADAPGKRRTKDFWRETFGQSSGEEREHDRDARENEEERQITPPQKVDGIGDEPYWSAAGSALYVLKKDVIIRISIGGMDNEETKIKKLTTLVNKALQHL